jgi:hypothetical protein
MFCVVNLWTSAAFLVHVTKSKRGKGKREKGKWAGGTMVLMRLVMIHASGPTSIVLSKIVMQYRSTYRVGIGTTVSPCHCLSPSVAVIPRT